MHSSITITLKKIIIVRMKIPTKFLKRKLQIRDEGAVVVAVCLGINHPCAVALWLPVLLYTAAFWPCLYCILLHNNTAFWSCLYLAMHVTIDVVNAMEMWWQ